MNGVAPVLPFEILAMNEPTTWSPRGPPGPVITIYLYCLRRKITGNKPIGILMKGAAI